MPLHLVTHEQWTFTNEKHTQFEAHACVHWFAYLSEYRSKLKASWLHIIVFRKCAQEIWDDEFIIRTHIWIDYWCLWVVSMYRMARYLWPFDNNNGGIWRRFYTCFYTRCNTLAPKYSITILTLLLTEFIMIVPKLPCCQG